MKSPITFLMLISMAVCFGIGFFYLGMSYYFMFKSKFKNKWLKINVEMSIKDELGEYVKHKYYIRAYRFAFIASILSILIEIVNGYYYLLGLSIVWACGFFILWRMFIKIYKKKEKELSDIKILFRDP